MQSPPPKPLKNDLQMRDMHLWCFAEHDHIINGTPSKEQATKNLVHHSLGHIEETFDNTIDPFHFD